MRARCRRSLALSSLDLRPRFRFIRQMDHVDEALVAIIELDEEPDHSRLGNVGDPGVNLVADRVTAPCRVACVHRDIVPGRDGRRVLGPTLG